MASYDNIPADMTKKVKPTSNNTNRLIPAGVIMLLITPIIQPIFIAIAQLGCPIVGGRRNCEFEQGLQIAVFANALPWVWLIVSVILIIAGITAHKSNNNT